MSMASKSGLLSPAGSITSLDIGIQHGRTLPLARTTPLKPGSAKEIALINYVDDKILQITRRYGKKFSSSENDTDDARGYETFDEVVQDLDRVFDIVWISGTQTLQVPYLLTLAGLFCSYMPAFAFSSSMFRLVKKLDEGFAHLLRPPQGPLAVANGSSYQASTTDRVRIKSLAEETRVVSVKVGLESSNALELEESETDEDENGSSGAQEREEEPSHVSMSLSKIYKRTIEILGDSLV